MQATRFGTPQHPSRSRRRTPAALIVRAVPLVLLLFALFALLRLNSATAPPVPADDQSIDALAGEASSFTALGEPDSPPLLPLLSSRPLAGRNPDGLSLHVLRYVPLITEICRDVGVDPAV